MNNFAEPDLKVVALAETTRFNNPTIYPLELGDAVAPTDSLRMFRSVPWRITERYGPAAFEKQLSAGSVYLDVGVLHGGPPPSSTRAYRREWGPEVRISEFLKVRPAAWETDGAVGYRVSFGRWGRSWEVLVVARKPFASSDLESAFDAVSSIRFPSAPVVTSDQALEAASLHLPSHMEFQEDWDGCASFFHYDTITDSLDGAFRVEFRVLDGTRARSVVRRCAYRVERDGSIERLECPEIVE